jgi:hypothetical protein
MDEVSMEATACIDINIIINYFYFYSFCFNVVTMIQRMTLVSIVVVQKPGEGGSAHGSTGGPASGGGP